MKNKPIGPLQKQVLRFIMRTMSERASPLYGWRFSFHQSERRRMEQLEKRGFLSLEDHMTRQCHVSPEQLDKIKLALYRA